MQVTRYVMLIDDDPIFNLINKRMIEVSTPYTSVIAFEDAREALKCLSYLDANDRDRFPHTLMIDINMPEIDGWKFLDRLSEFPKSILTAVKIFMLTSSINEHDIEKSKRYLIVSGFLSKPLLPKTMETLFQSAGRTSENSLPRRA
jgi:two-component system chemotaxis response regulator CheY